jgi:hypothetical protein
MIPDFASAFDVDFERGLLIWRNPPKNHAEKAGREAGFVCLGKGKNKSYWHVRAFSRTFKRSRVIFAMAHGRWPEPAVDHADGNSLNDALTNLRECTLSQNGANSRDKERTTDLPRGVSSTRQGRYIARLTKQGRTVTLGTHDTPEQARVAYDAARKEAFGDFA